MDAKHKNIFWPLLFRPSNVPDKFFQPCANNDESNFQVNNRQTLSPEIYLPQKISADKQLASAAIPTKADLIYGTNEELYEFPNHSNQYFQPKDVRLRRGDLQSKDTNRVDECRGTERRNRCRLMEIPKHGCRTRRRKKCKHSPAARFHG